MPHHSTPFAVRELEDESVWDRLLQRPHRENALIELTNRLAGGVGNVSVEDRRAIEEQYEVDFSEDFSEQRERMLHDYLTYCLADGDLVTGERAELNRLVEVLALTNESVQQVRTEAFEDAYRGALRERIVDRRLNDDELAYLGRIQGQFQIGEERERAIRTEEASTVVRAMLNEASEDGLVSPEEDAEVQWTLANLDVGSDLTEEEVGRWLRYRLYWDLENGPLPVVESGLNLQKNEVCHFLHATDWFELRTETRRVNYGGPTARIRIVKGIYWSAGSLGVKRVSRDVMRQIDTGVVYLTNKRILFVGQKRNMNIRLNRVLDFTPYTDGVEITKDAGRSPVFTFTDNIDVFCLTLNRLLGD